jgi:hypothetical protein
MITLIQFFGGQWIWMGVIQFLDDSSRVYALLSSSSLEVNGFEWVSSSFWMIVVGFLP